MSRPKKENYIDIPVEELKRLYLIDKLEVKDIAKHFGVTRKIIFLRIQKHNIYRRGYNRCLKLENTKVGKLLVLKQAFKKKDNNWYWECLCECGATVYVRGSCLRSQQTQSCGCVNRLYGKECKRWSGIGELSGELWSRYQTGAKGRNLEFLITKEYAWNLFLQQDGKCALTGIQLEFGIRNKDLLPTASIDRIDSTKGYIDGNIRWVHKQVNRLRWDLSDEEFLNWCNKILIYHQDKGQKDIEYFI